MEREWEKRPPDHEGYLAFKKALTEKDSDVAERALEAPDGSSLDEYMRLRSDEASIRQDTNEPLEELTRYRQDLLGQIRNEQTRERMWDQIKERLAAWDVERRRYDKSYREHSPDDITAEMNRRRAEHPQETRSQALFQAMRTVTGKFAHDLYERRDDIHRDIADIVEKARVQERPPQMGDPGYAAWREQQRQKDRDRGR